MNDISPLTTFTKSSYSGGGPGTDCIELAHTADGGCAVRDSKDPDGPLLVFSREAWSAFLHATKDGRFGHQLG